MIEILYMLFGSEPTHEQCEGWIRRFPDIVSPAPLEVRCETRRIDGDLRARLEAALDEDDISVVAAAAMEVLLSCEEWELREGRDHVELPKIVVVCSPNHRLARSVQASSPGALWGACIGDLAVIYHHEAALIWHEMFHLLGAEDCYEGESPDGSAMPTCGNARCIMQYAPSLDAVGDPPFMCQSNVERIRQRVAELARKESE